MEKTITIGDKDVRLSNNISWAIIYRNQFGQDIIASLLPMISGAIDIVAGLIEETGKTEEITLEDMAKLADGGALIDALAHIGAFELVDFINITWSMAKVCDDSLPEPIKWVSQFEAFPLDIIGPAVFGLIMDGMISSKNLERLKSIRGTLRPAAAPSTSTALSSPGLSEG